jgi:tRNA-splicing endonuclease subunit Sen54
MSTDDIYRRLSLIPHDNPTIPHPPVRRTTPPFRLAYYVYKPSTPFRKSAPPNPDFRIAVINARTQTTLPTLSQLRALLEGTPLDPPQGEKMERHLYMRLRHGYRSVIMAVVDQGVVSFLRFGDAGFSKETIYEDKSGPKGPKKGGISSPGRKGKRVGT